MGVTIAARCGYCCVLFLLLTSSLVSSEEISLDGILTAEEEFVPLTEPCTAIVKEIMAMVDRATLSCLTPSGKIYSVPLVDTQWIRQKELQGELFSGETSLDIPPNTMIDTETQTLQLDTLPGLLNIVQDDTMRNLRRLRSLEKTTGGKTVLVIRVKATNSVTTSSEAQLADDVFGDLGDVNNLRTQYLACSYGQLEFQKTQNRNGRTTNIRNGVVTITTGIRAESGDTKMINTINDKLSSEFGTNPENLADFIMYCLPPGTMHQYDIAYAWMNGYQSVYNNEVCSHVSAQMHEVGHNLNLAHSGHGQEAYGDQSGLMGYSYESDELPVMCFNSAKSWQLGWYADKALTVTPLSNRQYEFFVRLASIVDYQTTASSVLIQVKQSRSPWAFFMNYNAAKGMNKMTQEGEDQVLVTMKNTNNDENVSMLTKLMDPGDSLELKNFNGINGENLKIQFVSLTNGEADIAIFLSGPSVPSPTLSPTALPSPGPTKAPTKSPTKTPTSAPQTSAFSPLPSAKLSAYPTGNIELESLPESLPEFSPKVAAGVTDTPTLSNSPSISPSINASASPSSTPTATPSIEPSLRPTPMPTTLSPTVLPGNPTRTPSFRPSHYPTTSPSMSPTNEPSMIPTNQPSIEPSLMPTSKPSMSSVAPTNVPSMKPSNGKVMRNARVPLKVVHGSEKKLNLICDGTKTYIEEIIYETYGNDTETNVTCSTDDSTARDQLSEDKIPVLLTAQTCFVKESTAPRQDDYNTYVNDLMSDEGTQRKLPMYILRAALAHGLEIDDIIAVELDTSVDPPSMVLSLAEDEPAPATKLETASSGVDSTAFWWSFALAACTNYLVTRL